MDKLYVCPVCFTKQKKSRRRVVSSEDCCEVCEKFVRALQRPYHAWLNPSFMEYRRSINDRHPGINSQLLRKLMKGIGNYGTYTTEEEIVDTLRLIREKLYVRFDTEIRSCEQYQLLIDALNMLDHLHGFRVSQILQSATSADLSIQDYATKNISINEYVGIVSKALERIVECALSYDGFSTTVKRSQQGMIWLLELAVEIAIINQIIENVVSLWHRGDLRIDRNGWHWQLLPEDQNRHDELLRGWSVDDVEHERAVFGSDNEGLNPDEYIGALKKLDQQTEITGRSALGYDDEELIITINDIHKIQFGHKYSERLEALLTLVRLPKILDRDWIFEDELANFLSNELGFSDDISISILDSLCLHRSLIRSENARPFEFGRKFRLNRRPLLKITIGNRNAYYLSVPFMACSFLHIPVEYHSGSHPELENTEIKREISRLKQKYADYFVRERVCPIFRQNGFVTDYHIKSIGHFDLTREECGEIDVIAFDKSYKELIIAECKHKVGKEIHVSQMRNEIQKFTEPSGFIDQLTWKVNWVKNHVQDVLNHLKAEDCYESVKCTAIIITNYFCPASIFVEGITFIMEPKLDHWCKERIHGA